MEDAAARWKPPSNATDETVEDAACWRQLAVDGSIGEIIDGILGDTMDEALEGMMEDDVDEGCERGMVEHPDGRLAEGDGRLGVKEVVGGVEKVCTMEEPKRSSLKAFPAGGVKSTKEWETEGRGCVGREGGRGEKGLAGWRRA